jgi:hypothetical protein
VYERRHQRKATATDIVRPTALAVRPQPLLARSRSPLLAAAAVGILLALALLLYFQVNGFIAGLETRQAAVPGDARLAAMGQQMEVLRGKFNGLLAESVESRLRLLQRNVEAGKASPEDLRAFAELQHDLALLETYASRGAPIPDPATLEHARYQPLAAASAPRMVRNEELLVEVRQLKVLLYSCAAILAAGCLLLALYGLGRRRLERTLEYTAPPLPELEPPTRKR